MVLGQLGRGSGRGIEPFRKCWAGEGGVRSGQQGTRLIQRMVWVGRVGHTFDPHRISASSHEQPRHVDEVFLARTGDLRDRFLRGSRKDPRVRSEEHTSELQSSDHLVCRLLLEKKKTNYI